MAVTNIFDTRHIMNQAPKMGNRFLLTANTTKLNEIVNGGDVTGTPPTYTKPISKIKALNQLAAGNDAVFGEENVTGRKTSQILDLSLLSCTIPAFEFETAEVARFNDSVKHITKFSASNDMNATFYDYINGSAASIMLAWQSAVGFKLTGEIGYKKKYACDMNLYVYGPNRGSYKVQNGSNSAQITDLPEYELLMQFKILNAWPRSVDIGDYSYDSAEIKKVIVQFSYDMIIPYKHKVKDIEKPLQINGMGTEIDCGTDKPAADIRNSYVLRRTKDDVPVPATLEDTLGTT